MEPNSDECDRVADTSTTCIAPVNIAVIKYWGKSDSQDNLPLNSSISVTLDPNDLCATTTIMTSRKYKEDRMWLNGEVQDIGKNKRYQRVFREARAGGNRKRRHSHQSCHLEEVHGSTEEQQMPTSADSHVRCHVASSNNFPTAAGLASSAAGLACLAKCLGEAYSVTTDLSAMARLGSGSACRSMHGGFVKWNKGTCHSDSTAQQIASELHWPELCVIILVVSSRQKAVGSTEAMQRSVDTCDLIRHRAEVVVPRRIDTMEKAILQRDFATFAEVTMKESNDLHAICQATYPPICPPYLNDTSHRIIQLVSSFNDNQLKAAYTFDAGPNAVLLCLRRNFDQLLGTVLKHFPDNSDSNENGRPFVNIAASQLEACRNEAVDLPNLPVSSDALKYIICTKLGQGAHVVDSGRSLLDEHGMPRTSTSS